MADVNSIIATALRLPAIPDTDIQRDFNDIRGSWDAERIIVMSEADLRAVLAKILAADRKEGFKGVSCETQAFGLNGRLLQFNTTSETHFRGHRIAKKQNGQFALYGHDSTYRHAKQTGAKSWWQFWK